MRPALVLAVVEFDEFIYFYSTFITILQTLRSKGKPLIVHIRSIDNNVFTHDHVIAALSHFDAVSYIVEDKKGDFTLVNSEVSLNSNTYFLGKDVNSYSETLITRKRSYYRTSLNRVSLTSPKYLNLNQLTQTVNHYQKSGKTVAIVAGVFDVLHPGHISFLEKAKQSADILIILINSDFSTSHQPKNRNHDRPIHRLPERFSVLSALKFTTHIVPFDSKTALPILQSLPSHITYVKSVRDKEKKSIQEEIGVVKSKGGNTLFISNLRNTSGSVISSSMLITTCRKNAYKSAGSLEKEWSSTSQKQLQGLIAWIHDWNTKTGKITELRNELRSRYDGSLKTAVSIEQKVINHITQLTHTIVSDLVDKREYHWYVIPYLIGKMLDFPITISPVQLSNPNNHTTIINCVQRLGGKVVFFDTKAKKTSPPRIFEKQYRFIQNHYQFVARKNFDNNYSRVYLYPPLLHFSALSIIILKEEHNNTASNTRVSEITEESGKLWEYFENIPFDIQSGNGKLFSRNPRQPFPRLIAHGGAAVVSKSKSSAENSASGIRYALEAGIDAVEIDINVCKDGWVVLHESDLGKETEITGQTTEYTEKELQKVRIQFSRTPSAEKVISLANALQLVSKYKKDTPDPIHVKIDIKSTNPLLEKKLIKTITDSGILPEKVLLTSKIVSCSRRLQEEYPQFEYEFNAVDTNMLFYAYSLMDNDIMLSQYVNYFVFYAPFLNSKVVSLAQFVINAWGDSISEEFIRRLHAHNFQVHVWIASSEEEYITDAKLGADYVQLQDPELIKKIVRIKKDTYLPEDLRVDSSIQYNPLHAQLEE